MTFCLLLTQSGHAGYRWRTWAANPEGITGEELLDFVNGDLFLALKNLAVSTKPGDRRRVVTNAARKRRTFVQHAKRRRGRNVPLATNVRPDPRSLVQLD